MPSGLPVAKGSNNRSANWGGGPRSAVEDSHGGLPGIGPQLDPDLAARAGRFDCVQDQVEQRLPQLFGVGRKSRGPVHRTVDHQLDLAVPRGRRDQLHQLVEHGPQVAIGPTGGLRPPGFEKPLEMLFGQPQLSQQRPGFPGRRRGSGADGAGRRSGHP